MSSNFLDELKNITGETKIKNIIKYLKLVNIEIDDTLSGICICNKNNLKYIYIFEYKNIYFNVGSHCYKILLKYIENKKEKKNSYDKYYNKLLDIKENINNEEKKRKYDKCKICKNYNVKKNNDDIRSIIKLCSKCCIYKNETYYIKCLNCCCNIKLEKSYNGKYKRLCYNCYKNN